MSSQNTSDAIKPYSAKLIHSERITPASSREEVLNLVFSTDDLSFQAKIGQHIRVMAPGQYGNQYHTRYYSIADLDLKDDRQTKFTLCVRRCFYIDEHNGEQYQGVASNYLCDLKPGQSIEFTGPFGHPFAIPANKKSDLLLICMGTGIAPFRGFIRTIYEEHGGWEGKVRLFYGAKTGLEMLYMNDENNDLANYYDQKTFKAFQAVSPRPAMEAPIAIDQAIEQNASEIRKMLKEADTHVFIAGPKALSAPVEKALATLIGSDEKWSDLKSKLISDSRWHVVLY